MASKSHRAIYDAPAPSKGVRRWKKAIRTAVAVQRLKSREYNKASIAMAKIIVEEYKLLQSKLARPLTQRPVIAYKKNKSLKDILEDINSREIYKPPDKIKHISPFKGKDDCLQELQSNFSKLCRGLVSLSELPYNPYTGFIRRFSQISQRFHLGLVQEEDILCRLNPPLELTSVPHLYKSSTTPAIYGVESVLKLTDPIDLNKYQWLIDSVTTKPSDLPTRPGHSMQVISALVGPAIFSGSFHKSPRLVQIRQEFVVVGTDVKKAIQLFAESILTEVLRTEETKTHILQGMILPTQEKISSENKFGGQYSNVSTWTDVFWEIDRIHIEKDKFLDGICEAVLGNRMILMQCVFQLELNSLDYVQGQVQYQLNFVEVGGQGKEEGLTSFTDHPMSTIHEGIFLKKAHSEAYMGLFLPMLLGQKNSSSVVREKPSSITLSNNDNRTTQRKQMKLKKFVQGVEGKPVRVQLDGFRFEDLKSEGPFVKQIINPLRLKWEEKLSALDHNLYLIESLYFTLVLLAVNRGVQHSKVLVEIGRIFNSDVASLADLVDDCKILAAIAGRLQENGDLTALKKTIMGLKKKLDKLFGDQLREYSSDEETIYKVMLGRIHTLLDDEDGDQRSDSKMRQVVSELRSIGHLLQTVLVSKTEDFLTLCPELQKLLSPVDKPPAQENPININRQSKPEKQSNAAQVQLPHLPTRVISHGFEDAHMSKHNKWVVRVSDCVKEDSSPQSINKESVLIKYMLDVHLDEVWRDFLIGLFTQASIPPNPYPKLITAFRHAALKMDLWFEEEGKLSDKLCNGLSRPVEDLNYLHYLPSCKAYGASGLLAILDPEGFTFVTDIAKDIMPKFYIQMKGLFRVAICTAVVGPAAMYGRLKPYLTSIDLDEHIYVKGPDSCSKESIQLFANIVMDQVKELNAKGDNPVLGIFFGQNRMSAYDLELRPSAAITEFINTCKKCEPIVLKVYVKRDWRYYLVQKTFKLHWVSSKSPQLFYERSLTEFYQSVFLEKERAMFYCQNEMLLQDNPKSRANILQVNAQLNQSIKASIKHHDFYRIQELLTLGALARQDWTSLQECWRMFHSMAGQVEYLNSLITALKDLLTFALEFQTDLKNMEKKTTDKENPRLEISDPALGPLNLPALHLMAVEFQIKAAEMLKSQMMLSSKSVGVTVLSKIGQIFINNPQIGHQAILIEEKTIFILKEIQNMLVAISNMISADLHQLLPLAKAAVNSISIGETGREKRILSASLSQPNTFLSRPKTDSKI